LLFAFLYDKAAEHLLSLNIDKLVAELFTQFIHQQYLGQQFYMIFYNRDRLFFARQMDEGYMKRVLE